MPNLCVPDIVQAVRTSKAPKIYICNVMTQPGETDDYTVSDHIRAINRQAGGKVIDFVIANNGDVDPAVLQRYVAHGSHPVMIDKKPDRGDARPVGFDQQGKQCHSRYEEAGQCPL